MRWYTYIYIYIVTLAGGSNRCPPGLESGATHSQKRVESRYLAFSLLGRRRSSVSYSTPPFEFRLAKDSSQLSTYIWNFPIPPQPPIHLSNLLSTYIYTHQRVLFVHCPQKISDRLNKLPIIIPQIVNFKASNFHLNSSKFPFLFFHPISILCLTKNVILKILF